MRKAFQNGAMVSLDSKTLKAQVFRFKNNPRRGGPQGEARGANVDYTFGESGAGDAGWRYMRVYREGTGEDADVYDGRASWTALPGLTFSGEYAYEDSRRIHGKGYYAQALYEFQDVAWNAALTYRYALFNDEFNTLAYGYTDYGYWFQGEIAGNYPLFNNNLESNMVRAEGRSRAKAHCQSLLLQLHARRSAVVRRCPSDDFGDEVD